MSIIIFSNGLWPSHLFLVVCGKSQLLRVSRSQFCHENKTTFKHMITQGPYARMHDQSTQKRQNIANTPINQKASHYSALAHSSDEDNHPPEHGSTSKRNQLILLLRLRLHILLVEEHHRLNRLRSQGHLMLQIVLQKPCPIRKKGVNHTDNLGRRLTLLLLKHTVFLVCRVPNIQMLTQQHAYQAPEE